ncbi:MAG TPA: right-handed parallel beta-helix repeat-containing protein [Thermoleophilaceae bacterium]
MRFPAPVGVRRHACVLTVLVAALAAVVWADLAVAAQPASPSGTTAAAKAKAKGKQKSACRILTVKVRKGGKLVRRHGKVVKRTLRICPKKRCTLTKVKQRTKRGKVVRRHGRVVYKQVWKCKARKRAAKSPAPGTLPGGGGSGSSVPPAGAQRRVVRACSQTVTSTAAVQSAVAAAAPGAVICLANGSYGKLTLTGAKAGEVVAQPATSGGATIDGAEVGGTNLTLEGFKVTDSIEVTPGSNHATVQFNDVSGGYYGVEAGPTTTTTVNDVTIRGNRFHGQFGEDAIRLNRYHDGPDADPYGVLVEGNEITGLAEDGNHNDCLQTVFVGDHLYFRRNYLHDNNCQGFFVKDQASPIDTIVVEDNLIVDHDIDCIPASLCPNFSLAPLQVFGPVNNHVVRNNTIWTPVRDGLAIWRGNGLVNVDISYNVLSRAASDTSFSGFSEHDNTVCKWEGLPSLSATSTKNCSPAFPNKAADDYRLPGGRGVTWAPAGQQYGP